MNVRFAAFASLVLLCGCLSMQDWYADTPTPATLPAEAPFTMLHPPPGRGGTLFLTLRLEDEDVVFTVDTGSPITVLDGSLRSRLGRRVGSTSIFHPYYARREPGGVYRAPTLYLGDTQLRTGRWVATGDLVSLMTNSPVRGILGMDCLRHYCIQLDFLENKLRFLNSDALSTEMLGRPFPLTFSSGPMEVGINAGFFEGARTLIDTGIYWDGSTTSKVLQRAVEEQKAAWADPAKAPATRTNFKTHFPTATFGGDTYSNLLFDVHFQNSIGLRFLGRHRVTFNFPKRTMYLLRQTMEPLPETIPTSDVPSERKTSF